jgi:hypothetical protein
MRALPPRRSTPTLGGSAAPEHSAGAPSGLRPLTRTRAARLVRPGQQPDHAERYQQRHRVQVHLAAPRAPAQTTGGRAAAVTAGQPSDHLPAAHRLPRPHRHCKRLVLGAEPFRMDDDHHATAGDPPRESDPAGSGSTDFCAWSGGQINAKVAPAVPSHWRRERVQHRERCAQRRLIPGSHHVPRIGHRGVAPRPRFLRLGALRSLLCELAISPDQACSRAGLHGAGATQLWTPHEHLSTGVADLRVLRPADRELFGCVSPP